MDIARSCFWYKKQFSAFLDSCKVPQTFYSHLWDETYKQEKMRIILEAIERQGKWDLLENIIRNAYNLKISDRDNLPDLKRAQTLLDEFKSHIWSNPVEQEIERRKIQKSQEEYEKSIQETKLKKEKILKLKWWFIEIQKQNGTQKAWYDLEKLFSDLLMLEWFEYHPPYKTEHEQIDWYFKYDTFDYIVELKATTKQAGQEEFSIFDGKIKGKWQSTRWFFISVNGFADSALKSAIWNSPRIICMDWGDLFLCLDDRFSFSDLMKHKVDIFVRKWEIFSKPTF